ncbi:MAG: hypothetical protein ACREF9_16245, partial [Opitutaceae bacterium]
MPHLAEANPAAVIPHRSNPSAVSKKGRATISKSDVFSRAFFWLGHRGHGGNTEVTEEDELLCALRFELSVLCDEIEIIPLVAAP